LEVAGMKRSTFYYHLSRLNLPDKYRTLRDDIISVYHRNQGRYGYRRITLTLRQQGVVVNHKTVAKLMKQCGIKCMVRVKKYRSYKGEMGPIAPNLLQRDFQACQPNAKLVTDVTEFALFGEKRYLSPVMDLYNGEILGYTISEHPNLKMVTDMLEDLLEILPKGTTAIVHSDQGWQYQNRLYQNMLKRRGLMQSMSRKGNCLDNAVMENFFGLLKSELLYLRKFSSMAEFVNELKNYIDYYNNDRIKIKLNGMSPVGFRTQTVQT